MSETKKDLEEQVSQKQQFVVFFLADEVYGVDADQVRDITSVSEITVLPDMPDFVEGTIDLRGQVITIIDLRKRFGLPERQEQNENRIIILEREGTPIGMIIDKVSDVIRLPTSSIDDKPELASDITVDLVKGIGKLDGGTSLLIVDLESVLSSEEMEAINGVNVG